jgi:alkanesulfonate monooxygenase SsuD/methylene tetrahydromethanopterin reductase-like flavin-dependent oxidoreductase (luciferase family)
VLEEPLALIATEAAQSTGLADVELDHDAPRLHLADARERLEHAHDFELRERVVAGWGTNPIIGTPEQVTNQLAEVSAAGIDGMVFGFLDYNEELKYFDSAVMPLLRQAGLRK